MTMSLPPIASALHDNDHARTTCYVSERDAVDGRLVRSGAVRVCARRYSPQNVSGRARRGSLDAPSTRRHGHHCATRRARLHSCRGLAVGGSLSLRRRGGPAGTGEISLTPSPNRAFCRGQRICPRIDCPPRRRSAGGAPSDRDRVDENSVCSPRRLARLARRRTSGQGGLEIHRN